LNTGDCLAVTRMLDETGFDGMSCADHLIYPRNLRSPYPTGADTPPWVPEPAWPDSWVMIGAMAALTTRLRFTNAVYIAPSRPLLEVAKQVAAAAMCAPWMGADDVDPTDVKTFGAPIERFVESVVARVR
jgi:alkanesulfonate monooxygenase SsuD/methylene tetrahydromethanopterin reductase-like flavin-dependent oxidoreductase (luciferase family)